MDFYRKLLFALGSNYTDACDDSPCDPHSCFGCLQFSPPIPIYPSSSEKANPLSHVVIIVIAVLSSTFLLVSYYAIIKKYCSRWRTPRVPPAQDSPVDDELDESTSPMNYIWYVNTVGLEESVINSIAICKYKKGEGLVEGTDCSVCLSEFEDDEKLRLLPKCNHAFHIPCIDTWLKSHVNCPLCRANIVSAPDPNSNCSDSSSVTHVENSQNSVGDRDGWTSEGEVEVESERQDGRLDAETLEALSLPRARVNSGIRVLSDLGGIQRSSECSIEMMGGAIQPVRRSVSMDSSAAAMFCLSLANLLQTDSDGGNNVNIGESSGARRMGPTPKYGRNRSLIKMVYSGSKRPFLFKGPIAMKRSLSSGGKFLSRSSRSKNSVLPL